MRQFSKIMSVIALNILIGVTYVQADSFELSKPAMLWEKGDKEGAIKLLNDKYYQGNLSNQGKYTLISYLSTTHQDSELLNIAIDETIAPAYALEHRIDSSIRLKKSDIEILNLINKALTRFPDRPQLLSQQLYWMADSGKLSPSYLQEMYNKARALKNAKVWEALGYAHRAIQEYTQALHDYSEALALDKSNRELALAKINVLKTLKSNTVAKDLASEYNLLKKDIVKEAAGTNIGTADLKDPVGLDALAEGMSDLNTIIDPSPELSEAILIDHVIGFNKQGKYADAVSRFEQIKASQDTLPQPALLAAQDSYQELKNYSKAKSVAETLVSKYPSFENAVTLYFIEISLNNYDNANKLAAQIVNSQPLLLNRKTPNERYNRFYIEAKLIEAQNLAYANRLAESKQLLSKLIKNAPGNIDLREFNATVLSWQDNHIQATSGFKKVISENPKKLSSYVGLSKALEARNNSEEALKVLDSAPYTSIKEKAKVDEARALITSKNSKFILESKLRAEKGSNTVVSNTEAELKSRLYSPKLGNTARLFVESGIAGYKLPELYTRNASGVGIKIDRQDLSVQLSGNYSNKNPNGAIKPLAKLSYTPIDALNLNVGYDATNNDIPIRAVQAGISAKITEVGLTYKATDLLKIGATTQYSRYSDGNNRKELLASSEYQAYSSPTFMMTVGLATSIMRNSQSGGVYYNPSAVDSVWGFSGLEFIHNLSENEKTSSYVLISGGTLKESGYGSGPSYGVEYQFRKQFNKDLYIQAGLGYNKRNYDGDATYRLISDLEINWMF